MPNALTAIHNSQYLDLDENVKTIFKKVKF